MANSKIIVVEGSQGAGKTTITDFLRHTLPYSNLYRLCGTSDSTVTGKKKAEDMYVDLLEYIEKMENKSINLIFDRNSFTDVYEKLLNKFASLDFDIYYITLYLEDEDEYIERLKRDGKAVFKGAEFKAENSIKQQRVYLEMADEIKMNYPNINVLKLANDKDLEDTKKELRDFLKY